MYRSATDFCALTCCVKSCYCVEFIYSNGFFVCVKLGFSTIKIISPAEIILLLSNLDAFYLFILFLPSGNRTSNNLLSRCEGS